MAYDVLTDIRLERHREGAVVAPTLYDTGDLAVPAIDFWPFFPNLLEQRAIGWDGIEGAGATIPITVAVSAAARRARAMRCTIGVSFGLTATARVARRLSATLPIAFTLSVDTPVATILAHYLATGDGVTTAYVLPATPFASSIAYASVGGLIIPEDGYGLATATFTFATAPGNLAAIDIAYYTVLPASTAGRSQSFTASAAQTDFVLDDPPVVGGVLFVATGGALGGTILPGTGWSLQGAQTIRTVDAQAAGTIVTVSYIF